MPRDFFEEHSDTFLLGKNIDLDELEVTGFDQHEETVPYLVH
jgi:hypothetical protein